MSAVAARARKATASPAGIVAERTAWLAAVEPCARGAARNSVLETLKSVRLESTDVGLRVTGCDGQRWVYRDLALDFPPDGADVAIPARRLAESLGLMPDGPVGLDLGTPGRAVLAGGGVRFDLSCKPAADFPAFGWRGDAETGALRLSSDALSQIRSVSVSVSTETTRPAIQCVHIAATAAAVLAEATDTHRALRRDIGGAAWTGPGDLSLLLRPSDLDAIQALGCGEAEEIEIRLLGAGVECRTSGGDGVAVLHTLGPFPAIDRVIPPRPCDARPVDRRALVTAIRRALSVAPDADKVRMESFSGTGEIRVWADGYTQICETLVEVEPGSHAFRFAANGRYLREYADASPGDLIEIHHAATGRAIQFRSPADPGWVGVVMPMTD